MRKMFRERSKEQGPPPGILALDDRAPSGLSMAREFFWQLPRLATSMGPVRAHGPEDGPPVLVLPGFLSTDRSTQQIRRAFARYGWRAHPWALGMNRGAHGELLGQMCERLHAIGQGEKVLVAGWSLGGLYAREIARTCPDQVRAVVTMGSPFAGDLKTNNNVRWLYERVAGHDVYEPPFPRSEAKPPVPTIAFWGRRDGVVAPNAARGNAHLVDRAVELDAHHMAFASWRPTLSRVIRPLHDFLTEVEGAHPTGHRPIRLDIRAKARLSRAS